MQRPQLVFENFMKKKKKLFENYMKFITVT